MALKEETIAKLTTTLAGDIDLFNEIINEVQTNDTLINEKDQTIQQLTTEKTAIEERSQTYLNQISNLLSKIPIGQTDVPQSLEAKLEEVKNREWKK